MQKKRTVPGRHLVLVGQTDSEASAAQSLEQIQDVSFEQQERMAWAHVHHAALRAVGMLDRANPGIDDLIELADASRAAAALPQEIAI